MVNVSESANFKGIQSPRLVPDFILKVFLEFLLLSSILIKYFFSNTSSSYTFPTSGGCIVSSDYQLKIVYRYKDLENNFLPERYRVANDITYYFHNTGCQSFQKCRCKKFPCGTK